MARLAGARLGFLLVKGEGDTSWRYLGLWPAGSRRTAKTSGLESKVEKIAEEAILNGYAWEEIKKVQDTGRKGAVVGVRLELEEEERVSVAVFFTENDSGPSADEIATRLKLVADTPAVYQLGRVAHQAKMDVVQFAEGLDVMVLLNEEKRYMAAAMTFCNEVASRYRCERISLGWLQGDYVRLQAMSHMERFEKKMDAVQSLEAAMEEAFDQDEEIMCPRKEIGGAVTRDHESFAKEQGSQYVLSLPIRLDDAPVGVLTCERSNEPFSEDMIRGLRLLCDQASRRLGDLKEHDRWFGARMMSTAREGLGKLWGVEHTFIKLIGVLICVALAVLLFGKMTYRVEASFILKTDDLAYLPAPFDGYIDEVEVKVGDVVQEGSVLLKLDTRELLLEESTAIANQNRYVREAEKARTEKALAEMKIAEALAQQARARLDLVRYHLAHAEVKAPFAGIVVEGDLEELLGAPVKKGDVLFKVALLEKMYAELKIDERDVHEVAGKATGEISFVSRPNLEFPIVVERVDPVAVTEEEGNVFLVRGVFSGEIAQWWRPGMSGVAKINVGKRNILWILTHRTIDFLRIFLWW
ncbi:MAG: efflux RND transporter periplasmic adaptor subunit [Nitrospirales bacterium]